MISAGNSLQWIVVSLLAMAVVMVTSASMDVTQAIDVNAIVSSRVLAYAILAVVAMLVVSQIDVRRLNPRPTFANPVLWLLAISVGLCVLAMIPGFGREVNGANRWVYLGPKSWQLSFQPSELAKWSMILVLAWWAARRPEGLKKFWSGLVPVLVILGGVTALIAIEDLGTGVLIGMVGVTMLVAGGARLWQLGMLLPAAGAGVYHLIVSSDYRMRRITSFLDPSADVQGDGYHLNQSLIAITEGGLSGRGLGNGTQKFGYLPEDTTDFLFSVVCSELGLAGAILVAGLYVGLIWISLGIMSKTRMSFGRLVILGVVLTIGLQAILNVAVVTGLVPTKGIALPLLSSGGTGWILCAAAVGLVAAIDRLNQLESEQVNEPESSRQSVVGLWPVPEALELSGANDHTARPE